MISKSDAKNGARLYSMMGVRDEAKSIHTCIKPDHQAGVEDEMGYSFLKMGHNRARNQSRSPVLGPNVHGVKNRTE